MGNATNNWLNGSGGVNNAATIKNAMIIKGLLFLRVSISKILILTKINKNMGN